MMSGQTMITYWLSVVVIGVNISAGIVYANNYPLTVIHTNDIHSRIEETNKYCGVCKPEMKSKCFLKSIPGFYMLMRLSREK